MNPSGRAPSNGICLRRQCINGFVADGLCLRFSQPGIEVDSLDASKHHKYNCLIIRMEFNTINYLFLNFYFNYTHIIGYILYV